jgi:hypothetical protein
MFINYKIIKGLDFKMTGSINTNTYNQNGIVPSTIADMLKLPQEITTFLPIQTLI